MKCSNSSKCLKILLVADPQIIEHEEVDIWNRLRFITKYDSDSYLKRTYHQALNFVQPDVTIFLGDLMDEGSVATDEEYNENLIRFFNIFPKQGHNKQIWLPGDNDIGGEGLERVTPQKINRFKTHFKQADVISFQKVTFFKVNYLIHTFPKYEKRNFYDTNKINVVLSHVPLMFVPSVFVEKVISHLQPQVIFAGHKHRAMIINTNAFLRQDRHIVPITPEDNKVFKFSLGSTDMYEILVPTCSYRMGTDKIGFGYAIIENDELQYTVLWSPSRFHQLWNYILVLLLLLICCIIVKFYK
ncbi:uncharacterized protein C630.12 isoform X2 [Harmonia axyridis]|nr:uncharacterized protein C630.12 isoform X2 [Harmonia axyridis]